MEKELPSEDILSGEDILSEDDIPAENLPLLQERVQSNFIDLLFVVLLTFIFAAVLDKYENTPNWVRIVLFFGLWGLYEPLSTALGCTIGQYIKKIRVRRYSNTSRRINIVQAFFRYVIKAYLWWLSFIFISFSPEKRALHDYVVGSLVIRKK